MPKNLWPWAANRKTVVSTRLWITRNSAHVSAVACHFLFPTVGFLLLWPGGLCSVIRIYNRSGGRKHVYMQLRVSHFRKKTSRRRKTKGGRQLLGNYPINFHGAERKPVRSSLAA